MAQEYGAAEPIIDVARRAYRAVSNLPDPPRFGRQDTSGHDAMVRHATESFRQQAEKDAAAKQPVKRVPKRVPVRTPVRPVAGKRR